MTDFPSRNLEIFRLREEGKWTYRAIAELHDITLERARQIVAKEHRNLSGQEIGLKLFARSLSKPIVNCGCIDPLSESAPTARLEVSMRSANVLEAAGIKTVGELSRRIHEIRGFPNAGKKTEAELKMVVSDFGAGNGGRWL